MRKNRNQIYTTIFISHSNETFTSIEHSWIFLYKYIFIKYLNPSIHCLLRFCLLLWLTVCLFGGDDIRCVTIPQERLRTSVSHGSWAKTEPALLGLFKYWLKSSTYCRDCWLVVRETMLLGRLFPVSSARLLGCKNDPCKCPLQRYNGHDHIAYFVGLHTTSKK